MDGMHSRCRSNCSTVLCFDRAASPIAHSTTDGAGFLPLLIALAKEKGVAGYPGGGANLWQAVHIRDAAALFRLALEKGPSGKRWHAV
jgi:nucleoside-diphosphate-sugar epimerase